MDTAILLRAFFLAAAVGAQSTAPDQIWASFGEEPLSTLAISFSSAAPCATPAFKFGLSPTSLAPSPVTADPPFYFGNSAGLAYYYRARLSGLSPGTRYFYAAQACGNWSETLSTATLPSGDDFKVLVWGDMGRDGGEQILPALQQEARAAVAGAPGSAAFSVIAGDFAYDLHDESGARGARFMSRLSSVSAHLPLLVRAARVWGSPRASPSFLTPRRPPSFFLLFSFPFLPSLLSLLFSFPSRATGDHRQSRAGHRQCVPLH